jgi:hypothetical protein
MQYTRLYSAPDGESHFEVLESQFNETDYIQSAPPLKLSDSFAATQVRLMKAPALWKRDSHPSSARNLFIVLSGEWDVTASDGDARRFAAGDVLLVEDTTGKGHTSRVVSDTDSVAVMVTLSE